MADMRRSDDTGTRGFDNRGSTSDMVPVMMGEPDLGQRPSGVLKRGQRCLRITCIDQGCGTCLRVMQQHAVIIAAIGKLMDIGHERESTSCQYFPWMPKVQQVAMDRPPAAIRLKYCQASEQRPCGHRAVAG
ncbi:MAG: Uncharacterised protein [SAR116 cluster bacterium]|nr:MAG: Uncharacterised protein [SAR116 cluster bacterium]